MNHNFVELSGPEIEIVNGGLRVNDLPPATNVEDLGDGRSVWEKVWGYITG